jgi:Tfp pilus assembly protein PilO
VKIPRPLPKGAVLGGIVLAGLLVLVLGWMLVVAPQNHKAASLAKETADTQAQITSNLAQIAAAKTAVTATAAPKIRVADLYKLAKAMPSTTDMPDILLELSQVTKDAGVDLASIAPSTPTADPASGQQAVQISLSVSGDFFSLTDLLYRLRNFVTVRHGALDATGRLFTIDNVSFAPSGTHSLDANVTLHTYIYGGAPVAPVAVAPLPTDTSTTTTDSSTPPASPSAAGAGAP